MSKRSLFILALSCAATLAPMASAEAFWAARGWRGGVAVGGVGVGVARAPMLEPRVVYPECWRCAPYPAAGAAAAGVAIGAAAAARAASTPTTVVVTQPPAPAPAQVSAPTPAAPPPQTAAASGKAAGDACAQKLPPESRMIYDATVKNLGSAASIKDVVATQTRALVMQGKVQMSSAKSSAEATAPCLELVAKG